MTYLWLSTTYYFYYDFTSYSILFQKKKKDKIAKM